MQDINHFSLFIVVTALPASMYKLLEIIYISTRLSNSIEYSKELKKKLCTYSKFYDFCFVYLQPKF